MDVSHYILVTTISHIFILPLSPDPSSMFSSLSSPNPKLSPNRFIPFINLPHHYKSSTPRPPTSPSMFTITFPRFHCNPHPRTTISLLPSIRSRNSASSRAPLHSLNFFSTHSFLYPSMFYLTILSPPSQSRVLHHPRIPSTTLLGPQLFILSHCSRPPMFFNLLPRFFATFPRYLITGQALHYHSTFSLIPQRPPQSSRVLLQLSWFTQRRPNT